MDPKGLHERKNNKIGIWSYTKRNWGELGIYKQGQLIEIEYCLRETDFTRKNKKKP